MIEYVAYTAGYAGKTVAELRKHILSLDALVIDIRYAPWSRVEEWRRDSLLLSLGHRYVWIHALGNVNYKTGGNIELKEAAAGIDAVAKAVARQNVILLCGCKTFDTCHRSVVAELLRRNGIKTRELDWNFNAFTEP